MATLIAPEVVEICRIREKRECWRCSEWLSGTKLSNLHLLSCLIPCNNNSTMSKVVLILFLHWRGWGSEISSDSPKVTQHVCDGAGICNQAARISSLSYLLQSMPHDVAHLGSAGTGVLNHEETELLHPTWKVIHLWKQLLIFKFMSSDAKSHVFCPLGYVYVLKIQYLFSYQQ